MTKSKKTIDKLSTKNLKQFVRTLDNGIFKSLNNSTNMCNLLLVKIKNNNGVFHYIKSSNGKIEVPSDSMLSILLNTMKLAENKLCSFTVNKDYVNEQYDTNNISLVLFSKHINQRSKKAKYVLCGLLFLKEFRKHIIYLSLICSKPKIGSAFILVAEKLSQKLGYDKLKLVSIDDPLGFYIHKGYSFLKGHQIYEIPKKVTIKGLKFNKHELYNSYSQLLKHAGYLDSGGHVIPLKNTTKLLTKRIKTSGFTRKQLTEVNKKVDILFNIKKNDDGIHMYKKL